MAVEMGTVLGRWVDNRWEALKDAVLYVLHQWHRDPFNSGDIPMNVERIISDLAAQGHNKTDSQEVRDICEKLSKEGTAERIESGNFYYKITPEGVEYVEKLLTKLE